MPIEPMQPTAPEVKQRQLLSALLLVKLSAAEACALGASTLDVAEAIFNHDADLMALVRRHLSG